MSALRTSASVRRVIAALEASGSPTAVIELADTARTAADAARACGCEVGAIVKSLVFAIGDRLVMALIAGDRRCDIAALPAALGLDAAAARADPTRVRELTGFAIGGVAPLGSLTPLPTAIDASLARFPELWAAAGHPHCVFRTSLDELARLTGGRISTSLAPG